MARIAGINIPVNKHVVVALTSIYGIGDTRAKQICEAAGVAPNTIVRDLAEPEVAAQWLGRSGQPRVVRVGDWTKTLVGSEALARGVVNSLWQMVHGQPLRGRVVDPISAPHNDALDRLEANLVDDLMASRFDVARTLTLVIASPVTRRGIPEWRSSSGSVS